MNNLELVAKENRLIRKQWSRKESDGRQMLCLLTALGNDPEMRPESCPSTLAPPWLAHLLPWIDDSGSIGLWRSHIARLIPLADRLHLLGRRAELRCKRVALLEAMTHSKEKSVLKVCNDVLILLDRGIAGDEPTKQEWAKVAAAAAALQARWVVAAAAAVVVAVVAVAAAVVAVAAAVVVAAAAAVVVAAAAAVAAVQSAAAVAADRMIAEMIDVFEDELKTV